MLSRKDSRKPRLLALPLVLMLALLAVGGSSCGKLPSFNKATQDKLTAAIEKEIQENEVVGAVAGVWQKGKGQYVKAFGKSDLKSGRAVQVTDLWRAGSLTKTFTGIVVLQLAQEKKLALDEPITKYDFAKNLPNADKVTIRMLLQHTSGYSDLMNNDPAFQAQMAANPEKQWTQEEILKWGSTLQPLSPPGEQYHYSNWGYYLLGMIIEKASGKTAAQEIQSRCVAKAGLKNTSLDDTPEFLTSKAHASGYAAGGFPMFPAPPAQEKYSDATDWNTSVVWTAGSIVSDLDDMKTWIETVANGMLLNKQMQVEQLKTVKGELNFLYGLGVAAVPTNLGDLLLHNGAVGGYSSFAASTVDNKVTICVFMNVMPCPNKNTAAAMDTGVDLFKALGGSSSGGQ